MAVRYGHSGPSQRLAPSLPSRERAYKRGAWDRGGCGNGGGVATCEGGGSGRGGGGRGRSDGGVSRAHVTPPPARHLMDGVRGALWWGGVGTGEEEHDSASECRSMAWHVQSRVTDI